MLQKVREYAMVKFAGDKASVDQFVAGFVKEAMSSATPPGRNSAADAAKLRQTELDYELAKDKHEFDVRTRGGLAPMRTGFLSEAGKGMANLAVTLGVAGVGKIYSNIQKGNLHSRFLKAVEKTIASNEMIRNADPKKVMEYANTIFRFAPNVATDVNVLNAVLTNAIHGEVMDTTTLKALTDLESRYTENSSFTPKTYI